MDPKAVYCLGVKQGVMTPLVRNLLFDHAQSMIRTGIRKSVIKGDVEGQIVTEGKYGTIGHVSGQIFYARTESDSGTLEATYLVRKTHFSGAEATWTFPGDN